MNENIIFAILFLRRHGSEGGSHVVIWRKNIAGKGIKEIQRLWGEYMSGVLEEVQGSQA